MREHGLFCYLRLVWGGGRIRAKKRCRLGKETVWTEQTCALVRDSPEGQNAVQIGERNGEIWGF